MRNKVKAGLWLLLTGVMIFATVGCGEQKKNVKEDYTVSQDLAVKAVADSASISGISSSSESISGYRLGAKVDYPIGGPQPLADSVRQFVKRELYCMFDWNYSLDNPDEKLHIPFEKVCEWKGDNIVTDFINNYRPLYENEEIGIGEISLNLKLVAQTETFVTYYAEETDCGGSCNHSYDFYTFRKRDGELLGEILSKKDLSKFVKTYPQYKFDDDACMSFIGMGEEGLLFGIYIMFGASGGFHKIDTIPYEMAKPYLSKKAQELISDN